MTDRTRKIDLDLALVDPGAVFRTPEEVVVCETLTPDQRAEILRRWEYDARELDVAEDEGMRDGEPLLLDRITRALEALGYEADRDEAPPTKQGGVGSGHIHKTRR
jgi:hypothetical protein